MRTAFLLALFSATVVAQSAPSISFRGQRPLHASATAGPGDLAVKAGTKAMLFVDVTPNTDIHVYAPGAKDFIPVTIKFDPQTNLKFGKLTYPKSEVMTFANERVPVFEKPFRLTQEITLRGALKAGQTLPVNGTLNYQACTDRECYPPESIPLTWMVTVK